jgi:hypothetical protein
VNIIILVNKININIIKYDVYFLPQDPQLALGPLTRPMIGAFSAVDALATGAKFAEAGARGAKMGVALPFGITIDILIGIL